MAPINRPKTTLHERLAKIASIEEKYGLQNLVDIVMELTENPGMDLSDLSPRMRYAVLQVLMMDAAPHQRPVSVLEHIALLLKQRRRRMGLEPVTEDQEVEETASEVKKRVLPTLPGYRRS